MATKTSIPNKIIFHVLLSSGDNKPGYEKLWHNNKSTCYVKIIHRHVHETMFMYIVLELRRGSDEAPGQYNALQSLRGCNNNYNNNNQHGQLIS